MKVKFLEGKNIYIKGFERKDINADYLQFINDSSNNIYLTSNAFPKTKDDLVNYYNNNKSKNSILFSVFTKDKHIRVGNASISSIDWIVRQCSYGRLIKKEFQKKQFGSELLILMQKYVFEILNLNSMSTSVAKNNIASIRSNLKCGMKKIGIKKDAFFINNKYEDAVLLQLTKSQYLRFYKKN
tara:strand:- start:100 stop:651 length:552 start_codon:yes stop_codon:yes gene_type:complete